MVYLGGHGLSLAAARRATPYAGGGGAAVPQHLEKITLRIR
jgi:hypothetical protein|tara:strand:- start:12169 stop:12291 length:123 start_codon:yes stop_codon:yes gene_type:complete